MKVIYTSITDIQMYDSDTQMMTVVEIRRLTTEKRYVVTLLFMAIHGLMFKHFIQILKLALLEL